MLSSSLPVATQRMLAVAVVHKSTRQTTDQAALLKVLSSHVAPNNNAPRRYRIVVISDKEQGPFQRTIDHAGMAVAYEPAKHHQEVVCRRTRVGLEGVQLRQRNSQRDRKVLTGAERIPNHRPKEE
eukprot:TRINITY_DN20563_c0_g1_i1.p1 TRINITY_DN20563_c0_g1~~TRINITY_DN20563_c0_g1_i1.p1  ORF type:complete len:126 (+),score=4.22 TRINITY_DN20563_c0_g1_i1:196-573(+)